MAALVASLPRQGLEVPWVRHLAATSLLGVHCQAVFVKLPYGARGAYSIGLGWQSCTHSFPFPPSSYGKMTVAHVPSSLPPAHTSTRTVPHPSALGKQARRQGLFMAKFCKFRQEWKPGSQSQRRCGSSSLYPDWLSVGWGLGLCGQH